MNRRGFLSGMLALGAAPAIVRADSLMKLIPTTTSVLEYEADFAWYSGYEGLQVVTPSLPEIIATTLRNRQAKFADNVMRSNELLRRMKRRGLVQSIDLVGRP